MDGRHLLGSIFFATTAAAWFAYFRKKTSQHSFATMVLAVVGGLLSAMASVAIYAKLEAAGVNADWRAMQQSWGRGIRMSLLIGFVEEGAKLVPVLVLALMSRKLARSRDGILLAACAGLGFAVAENVIFSQQGMTVIEGVARAAATPVTHALFSAPWGLGVATLLIHRRASVLAWSFSTSVAAHGLYDFLLARPHVPLLASAAVVLALWIWLIVRTTPKSSGDISVVALRPALATAHD